MRRHIRAAAIAVTLAGIAIGPPSQANARLDVSTASAPGDANQQLRERQCRFQWLDEAVWSDREERRTAACVVAKYGVVGGLATVFRVGECESHWYRFANNGGQYLGIFQHAAYDWPRRVRHQMPDGWKVGPWWRWTNPRSQIVTTVRMVNGAGGWSAWSCA